MSRIKSIIEKARTEDRVLLNEIESKTLLAEAGVKVVEARLAASKQEAVFIAEQLGLPSVLKIVSPEITHKSDAGGVKVNLRTADQVGKAYEDIVATVEQNFPGKAISGVAVQKMFPPGIEVIVGMTRDAQFGPMLMFGLGGILVELLKDVSFRIVPLTKRDAREMIREIKSYPVLAGYRGQPGADVSKLEEMLIKISAFLENDHEIQELDLNPVFAYADDAVAVDARVILRQKE